MQGHLYIYMAQQTVLASPIPLQSSSYTRIEWQLLDDVVLDNNISYSSLSSSNGILFQQDSLASGTHVVTLTAHPSSPDEQLGFHQAVVTMQIDSG